MSTQILGVRLRALISQKMGTSGNITISTTCIQIGFGLKNAMMPRTRLFLKRVKNGRLSGDNSLDRIVWSLGPSVVVEYLVDRGTGDT